MAVQVSFDDESQEHFLQFYSRKDFDRLVEALGTPALATFLRINTLRMTRPQAVEVVDNYLREQCAEKHWDPPLTVHVHPVLEDVLFVVGFPVDVRPVEREVMVDKLCGNAVLRGSDIYAAGVLAVEGGTKQDDSVAVYVDLDGTCLRGQQKRHVGNRHFVGNGVLKLPREAIYRVSPKDLSGVGITMNEPIYRLPSFGDLITHGVQLQNLPSILIGHVLNPQPGELILDMCAAPGGKTTHLANLTQNKATIIALDRSQAKIHKLVKHLKEQGSYPTIHPYACDSSSCVMSQQDSDAFYTKMGDKMKSDALLGHLPDAGKRIKKLPRNFFDRIVLDPPCSALGQRPLFFTGRNFKWLQDTAKYQRCLIHSAHRLLKPGGYMTFSTCTINPAENEENVAFVLSTFPDMELLPIPAPYNQFGLPGMKIERVSEDGMQVLSNEERSRVRRFEPGMLPSDQDSIGFFFALFRKREVDT
ncbi:S-adenosyl-L-methionine-dependent methyltransferase [Cladochytrium replicatum]|nr:S-adenosyl-L-methionine-dependent methyltransferase [Cladochytrium replicatum]